MLAALFGVVLAMSPQPVTNVRPFADVIEVRPGMVASDADRRDQVRFGRDAGAEVVAVVRDGQTAWDGSAQARARYGAGPDAPELIYVRAYDAVFAIDPFVALPQADELSEFASPVGIAATRQLFQRTSLQTDRTLFDRRRIERTQELFGVLERARRDWLRANGYAGVRTFRNPSASQSEARTTKAKPVPAGRFRKPADWPATKGRESVDADDVIRRSSPREFARSLADGSAPVRFAAPAGSAPLRVADAQAADPTQAVATNSR